MIKKHLVICSVVLVLCMVITALIKGSSGSKIQPNAVVQMPVKYKTEPVKSAVSLSFANEVLPVKDARVKWRMAKMLNAHSYKKLQTHRLHVKASQWFPVMEPILKYYGIPEDFKYIPLVESGMLSGTSSKGASGYWQFMPQTARDYGLKVNANVDERHQVRKSTVAACKYLRSLYIEFHNWTLVAAAYNLGENKLKRRMIVQHKHNYFKMKLNAETASYVYKLVSMKQIIENPVTYGYARSKTLMAQNVINTSIPRAQFNIALEQKSMLDLDIQRN